MSTTAPLRIFVAAEGPTDLRRVKTLIDHLLRKREGGARPLEELRTFEMLEGQEYVRIHSIPELAKRRGFDRRYTRGDGDTIRKLQMILRHDKLLDTRTVIIWARDEDGDANRKEQAIEAKRSLPGPAVLLLAMARECGEAWVIAGWRPGGKDPKLQAWRRRLGFMPNAEPWRLSHKQKENLERSAKAVLRDIFDGDLESEASALVVAAESDSQASRDCGLRTFWADLDSLLGERRLPGTAAEIQARYSAAPVGQPGTS